MSVKAIKTNKYQIFSRLIRSWKPRTKKIRVTLKDISKEAGITQQHLTKIITGKFVKNPRIKTIDAIENAICAAEERAGVK